MSNKFKISAVALSLIAASSVSSLAYAEQTYIVKMNTGLQTHNQDISSQSQHRINDAISNNVVETLVSTVSEQVVTMVLSEEQVALMTASDQFVYIEEDFEYTPFSSTQISPYGIGQVQANLVSDANVDQVKVCVIDSGYDLGHPDLPQNATGFADAAVGLWYKDGSGHGTHVAGSIAAINNSVGVVGVLPSDKVGIHAVRVFDDEGKQGLNSRIGRAVDNCVEHGANVINMSLGGASKSQYLEERLNAAYDQGVLIIAAAGNGGDATLSYPASYDSVVSVANIDKDRNKNDSSQFNAQVEISGPGTDVLSTVPRGTGIVAGVTVQGAGAFEAAGMTHSVEGKLSAELADCGQALTTCTAPAKICLIERGGATFAKKAQNCEAGGGVAALVYNNAAGSFGGTLGDANHGVTIPVLALTQVTGNSLKAHLSKQVTAQLESISDYDVKSGTSMASPHVAGVAALVWSNHSQCTNVEIRNALNATAIDLGDAGRDHLFGYGLVQAKAAADYLTQNGCAGTIQNQVPIAQFNSQCTGLSCSFDASGSRDTDGTISRFDWIINGQNVVGKQASHTFPQAGTYSVKLTVTDNEGATANFNKAVTVTEGNVSEGCDGITAWSANKTYTKAGTLVSYNGKKYSNNWWHSNKNPEQNSNVGNNWKVWTDLGLCK
ncbi:S8 family serine peptidase [Pseudoalteromonas sp. MMG013]|uniref:S8 family serine peptidase n=1 Tax=Pseudoalteromonas sp. MMG013 TaxID=2822687 RepID=UPI001B3666C9|nr:S8 family serine peptidase [Pseudoalteromonas sp. MMG013]MBQ4861626.1 S8 family serine peptidase [Pseudoalteromonas sp. MMG013]